jgi:hypothetical protein
MKKFLRSLIVGFAVGFIAMSCSNPVSSGNEPIVLQSTWEACQMVALSAWDHIAYLVTYEYVVPYTKANVTVSLISDSYINQDSVRVEKTDRRDSCAITVRYNCPSFKPQPFGKWRIEIAGKE